MKAIILLSSFIFICFTKSKAQIPEKLSGNALALVGEWERVGNLEAGSIGKIIFYPDGTLNIIHKKRTEVQILRYRLQTQTDPLRGEIISAPFGLGQLKDRILFTVHFNSPTSLDFKYTTGDKSQTIYLKKIKDIPHGIVPLTE